MPVFFFTDVEGSTRLWEEYTEDMGAVIARHDAILQQQIEACGGRITKHTGDGVTAAFEAGEPLTCALEAQRRFAAEPWGEIGELRIRVGLHAGEAKWIAGAEPHTGDYYGPPVNCAARIMSAAWGGQILLTPEVTAISDLPTGASLLDLGEHLLKNVTAPQRILQLLHPDLRRQEFPPPHTLSGESIRRTVDQQGAYIADLPPPSIAVTLVSATLVPVLQGDLSPDSPALAGNLGILDDLGAITLRTFTAKFAARLHAKGEADQALVVSEVRQRLESELLAQWEGGGDTSLALRADVSQLLRAVQGVQAVMTSATDDVREALARGLADLGTQFGEFRWILAGVQEALAEMKARQELQLSLQREHMAKTEEILQLQRQHARVAPMPALPLVAAEPPAFLEGEAEPFQQPVFVARERELARLNTLLQTALAGQGRVIFVAGGPGRGKTALLAEFARRAMEANPNLLVASGSCNAFSGVGDPYLPFREVLGMLSGDVEARWLAGQITTQHARRLWAAVPHFVQALLGFGPHILGALVEAEALLSRAAIAGTTAAPWRDSLRRAIERRQALPPGVATPGVEQSHLFEQYTNVLRQVGESYPLVLILDDVQWADSASIGLLFHLGRRLQGIPILIACAYRPEEVAPGRDGERHPLEKVLAEFRRMYGEVLIDLGQVDRVDDRRFVDAFLDSEPNRLAEGFRRALFEHTAGHPLFTVELLRAMQERGDLV
jgi:class 3 adenylate cyclase